MAGIGVSSENRWVSMRRYLRSCLTVVSLLLLGACLLSYLVLRPPDIEIPPRHYPPNNAYDHYKSIGISASELHRRDPQLQALTERIGRGASIGAEEYTYLQQVYGPLLTEYRRHLNQPCVAVLQYDPNYPLPELAGLREIARAERGLMDYELRQGRTRQALERFDSVVRLSQQIKNEGGFIHFLVGRALIAVAVEPVAQHLSSLDRAALESLLRACRHYEQQRVPLVESMQVEHHFGLSVIKQLREGSYHPANDDESGLKEVAQLMHVPFLRNVIYTPALKEYNRYMKHVIAELEKPYWQRKPIPEPEGRGLRGIFVAILIPVFSQAAEQEALEQAQMRLLGCAAAIRLYKLRTGRYPARLEELKLGAMIIDPFTGQPFRYRTDPRKGFLLYSVGVNRKDEGGKRMVGKDLNRGDIGPVPYRPPRTADGSPQPIPLGEPVWLR